MSQRDAVIRNNSSTFINMFSGLLRLVTVAGFSYKNTSLRAGFCWLIFSISLSLGIARLIFWSHSWNFSWMPAGLISLIVLFFVVVHLGIGPICRLFCDITHEIRVNGKNNNFKQPPRLMLRNFAKEYYTLEYLLSGCVVYSLVFVTLISYTNLKPAIPLFNPVIYDEFLFRWDNVLLHVLSGFGVISIPKDSTVSVFFDNVYSHMWTLACITLALTYRERINFYRLTASFCLAFVFSIPISTLFPSLGPAFYKPWLFDHIVGTNSADIMKRLWEYYLAFKMNPLNTSIVGGNGIMAMPSLHCTLVYLSVISLAKSLPALRFILWGFLLLYMIATVYLGWHYLLDGIAGIMLGWFVYMISSKWFYVKEISIPDDFPSCRL